MKARLVAHGRARKSSAREPMMQNAFAGRGMTAASIERSASTVVGEVS